MLRALGLLVLALAWTSSSEARSALDAQLRANHVYHSTKFVEWPSSTFSSEDAPLRLCVVASAGAPELEALAGRVARGRKIEVVSAPEASTLRGCQVLVFEEISATAS